MYRKAILILLTLLLAIILDSIRVESYEAKDTALKEAFKIAGANFKDVKLISWAKFDAQKDSELAEININRVLRDKSYEENYSYKASLLTKRTVVTEILSKSIEFDMVEIKKEINFIEKKAEKGSYISTIYEGYYNKILSKQEMEHLTEHVIDKLNISRGESYSDERMYVYQGYSPLITQYIELSGRNYNINIAFRSNKLEGKTYFFAGSPIISTEY